MFTGILAGFLTAALGWQTNLISLHRGVNYGRRAAFWTGVGAIIGDVIWITVAFAGAKTVLNYHHHLQHFKWLGIITICFAGLRILFHNPKKIQAETKMQHDPGKSVFVGLLIVGGNPALLILWLGIIGFVLTYVPDATHPMFHFWFVTGFMSGGMSWFSLLALVLLPQVKRWKEDKLHLISKVSAVLLLAAAVFLIFKKF